MTRDELILIGVNAERGAEGLPPLAADHPWTGHHSVVLAALTTLEAAGVKLVSVATLTALANACESNQVADKNVVQRLRDLAASPYRSAP